MSITKCPELMRWRRTGLSPSALNIAAPELKSMTACERRKKSMEASIGTYLSSFVRSEWTMTLPSLPPAMISRSARETVS
eukprot:9910564-Alexandrium_andersonii.AAC.1